MQTERTLRSLAGSLRVRRLPRLEEALFAALFAGVLGLGPRLLNADGDLGRHLTIGKYILESGRVPLRDLFSHTMAGEPLTPHEWLAQVLLALAHRLAGLDGVVVLSGLLIAATFTLVFARCRERSGSPLLSLGVSILAAAASSLHWIARPHLFTLLLAAIWLGEMERLHRGGRLRAWALAGLMLLWANLHAGFVAGFAIWGLYAAGAWLGGGGGARRAVSHPGAGETAWGAPHPGGALPSPLAGQAASSRQAEAGQGGLAGRLQAQGKTCRADFRASLANAQPWLAAGGLAFAASLANPVGLRLWEASLAFLRNRYLVGHTAEYLPPDFQHPSAWPFLAMIVLSLFFLAVSRERLAFPHALLLAGWTALALYSARNIPLYAVLAAPLLAGLAAGVPLRGRALAWARRLEARLAGVEAGLRGHAWGVLAAAGLVGALLSGARLDFAGAGNRFDPAVFPQAAMDWLQGQPAPGEAFNYFPWGGYLLFRTWPERRVFIDGQTDFYGEALARQYERAITAAPGWQEVFREYGVGWAILPGESALAVALRAEAGWREVYRDDTAAVFFRGEPSR